MTLCILAIVAALSAASTAPTYPENPFVNTSLPDKYDKFLCRDWKWAEKCRGEVRFSIESDWPSFLTFQAWDSCQGCKSAGSFAHDNSEYPADNSAASFQVIGDWMRISSLEQGSTVTLSGADNEKYWFNPPRDATDDKPLEIEWYYLMDASDFASLSDLTAQNWAAFWAFGHGTGEFGWPTGGEWDLLEWLPAFVPGSSSHATQGATSGFHNAISGAYPPCCMEDDNISYPAGADPETWEYRTSNTSDYLWPTGSRFRSWGQAMNLAEDKPAGDARGADSQTYNRVVHVYARCTTNTFSIWAKPNADPSAPPQIGPDTDPGADLGYARVFRAHGNFGSNGDTSYSDAFPKAMGQNVRNTSRVATNWHQNMAFVWSIVRFDGTALANQGKLLFYLSDIHIRGGGHSTVAQPPPGTPAAEIFNATVAQDGVSPCQWVSDGPNGCNGRLDAYYHQYLPTDYGFYTPPAPTTEMHVQLRSKVPQELVVSSRILDDSVGSILCRIQPSAACVVTTDFIVETADGKRVGDPFDEWWGDASYRYAQLNLTVFESVSSSTYLDYTKNNMPSPRHVSAV